MFEIGCDKKNAETADCNAKTAKGEFGIGCFCLDPYDEKDDLESDEDGKQDLVKVNEYNIESWSVWIL